MVTVTMVRRSLRISCSFQKYTQHRFSGTPAVHDHANVGVRSQPAATNNQSPSCPSGMRGTPLTSDITGYPLGVARTLSPCACTFTIPMEQRGGSAQIVKAHRPNPMGAGQEREGLLLPEREALGEVPNYCPRCRLDHSGRCWDHILFPNRWQRALVPLPGTAQRYRLTASFSFLPPPVVANSVSSIELCSRLSRRRYKWHGFRCRCQKKRNERSQG
jgi:hypothetical protein